MISTEELRTDQKKYLSGMANTANSIHHKILQRINTSAELNSLELDISKIISQVSMDAAQAGSNDTQRRALKDSMLAMDANYQDLSRQLEEKKEIVSRLDADIELKRKEYEINKLTVESNISLMHILV